MSARLCAALAVLALITACAQAPAQESKSILDLPSIAESPLAQDTSDLGVQDDLDASDESLAEALPEDAGGAPADDGGAPQVAVTDVSDEPVASTSGPMPARPTGTLFYDDFSEGFTDQWEYEFNEPLVDDAAGNPLPALRLLASKKLEPLTSGIRIGQSPDVKIMTAVEPFSISQGLHVVVEVSVPASDKLGGLHISLRDQAETYPNAFMEISPAGLNYLTRSGEYRKATGAAIRDTKWHKFELVIDANGNAKWLKDGVTKLTGYVKPSTYVLELRSMPYRTTDAVTQYYLVDNVIVRSLGLTPTGRSSSTTTTTKTTTTTSTKGTLSISDDQGYLFVGDTYIGKGRATVTASPGYYTVSALSPSSSEECWRRSVRVDAGKTTTVKIDSYCR